MTKKPWDATPVASDMPEAMFSRRLSASDAAFLYLERKEIPLCIACVCVFDEAIPFDLFVSNIDSKLHLVPRYLQIAVAPPFDLGYPSWEDDPHFDIRRHILKVTVEAPGGEKELQDLAGRLFTQIMDRRKPLWEIYVVDGLKGGRGALIVRIHHALADGVAGASLLKIMLDPTPEGSFAGPKRHPPVRKPAPVEHSLVEAIGSACHSTLENLIAAEEGILDFTQGLLSERMQTGLQELTTLLPEVASPTARLPFNKPCNGDRLFCWAEFNFGDVHAIRATIGCKVNDVVLAVLTRALTFYAIMHGQSVDRRLLRVICPVSIRREDQQESLGNRITFLPVVLPMDLADPMELLKAVAARTATMKNTRAAELVAIASAWLGSAPPPLQKLFWGGIPSLMFPAPLFNIICTNVPGSPATLYAVGKKMIASYPQVPTGYELGVGVAAQSYAGKLCFGLTADSEAAPDVTVLRDFIRVSFEDLCRAAGVKMTRPEVAEKAEVQKPDVKQKPAGKTAPKTAAKAVPTTPPKTVAKAAPKPARKRAGKPVAPKTARKRPPKPPPAPPPAPPQEEVPVAEPVVEELAVAGD
ncbi:MAG TPA: wax ester/triacylglycerol synthase family O-acyltransferase [Bryobacteraceae bacterium]|nr:wax ester/triacylglycerol synthase family O-acyltransferase [Bryobacteraceae bacterium]